ncbi:MAG TPA: ribonuclease Y, partial [Deltaproteobacteria bacterium]|nr:ribonuclease Y [Deltaproteobacteria bacterium]
MDTILLYIGIFIFAFFAGFLLAKLVQRKKIGEYEKIGKKILEDAKKEADVIIREASIQAKDNALQARNELEQEIKARRLELQNTEKRLAQK